MKVSRKAAVVAASVAAIALCITVPASAAGAMKNMQDKATPSSAMAVSHQVAGKSSTTSFGHGMASAKAAMGPNNGQ
jgi:hypothetical protein